MISSASSGSGPFEPGTWHIGHHGINRGDFVAHETNRFAAGPTNMKPLLDAFCEVGIFGKKPVAWMNRGSIRDFRSSNHWEC